MTTTFFFYLSFLFTVSSAAPIQLLSLLSIKGSFVDPASSLYDWNYTVPGTGWCGWSGVTCDPATGDVIGLDLSRRNLSGAVPPEIRLLGNLAYLNISGNAFDGHVQPAIFDLQELRTLDISRNNLSGELPPAVSTLRRLLVFNAYSNSFSGGIPGGLGRLRQLEVLNLGGSYFTGSIPAELGELKRLRSLHLAGNLLAGEIPPELGSLGGLERLEIGYNGFSGHIPSEFGLLFNLTYLDIAFANVSGPIPESLGNLTRLSSLFLFKNKLEGTIPSRFSRLKLLEELDLSDNKLHGLIPHVLAKLPELRIISLMTNNFSGNIPVDIGELPNLEILLLWNNSLSGTLPYRLGLNGKLRKVDVSSNLLSGWIPPNLCQGNQLFSLILFSNRFDSDIPPGLAKCSSLWRLRVQDNQLHGSIPTGFGSLNNITFMDLSRNNLSGQVPQDLGRAPRLEYLNVSDNPLRSFLPATIWSAPSMQIFSGSSCGLEGEIPDFIGCKSLYKIEMEGNLLNGSIPWDVGHCQKLLSLKLAGNQLTGIIPWELSQLPAITDVDLSRNKLIGRIPASFDNCSTLENFNVSHNLLAGPIPSAGDVFRNLHPSSFEGNTGLCGGPLITPCVPAAEADLGAAEPERETKRSAGGATVWIMAAGFGVGLFALIAGARLLHTRCGRRRFGGEAKAGTGQWRLTAFQRLNFTADDVIDCMSMSDKVIGMGAAGTVYRADMPTGEIIAVKRLWSRNKESSGRRRLGGVPAEVEVLGRVRHRNIVRLLGCCGNNECTMLLYEYMPNGSLDELLHGDGKGENAVAAADWATRYKIAVGVAQGMCYLHHDCDPVILHRDLKPSNILLDGEMEARVADFGVAKLIQPDQTMSVIAGSYGFIAPEYAYTLQIDEKSDVYSYGVVLLEMLTGKRSVEAEFGDGNSIVDWVRAKVKSMEGAAEVLDKNAGAGCSVVRDEMMLVLRIALLCTSKSPAERPSMRDVLSMVVAAMPKRKMLDEVDEVGVADGGGDPPSKVMQES